MSKRPYKTKVGAWRKFGKSTFDVFFAAVGLCVTSPLLIAIAGLIKIDSEGPVFYRGLRTGKGGRPFRMFKFRTMVIEAEKKGGPSTAADDPRVTRVGKLLRKYKIDELPQLINVVRGEMSLVGPRPEVLEYAALLRGEEKEILSITPGMTDWASLWNPDEGAALAGSPDPERTYLEKIRPAKLRLQLEYVKKQSMLVDLRILFETMVLVVFRVRRKIDPLFESATAAEGSLKPRS